MERPHNGSESCKSINAEEKREKFTPILHQSEFSGHKKQHKTDRSITADSSVKITLQCVKKSQNKVISG